ncbi:MAG: hypothetical protein R3A13_07245 [Bdellovibrionota bacterium]
MKILKPKKKKQFTPRDPKKDRIFKDLSDILHKAGFFVRREELKRGHGWKVLSGECSTEGSKYIFVDRRMSQDEQIAFLLNKIITSGIEPTAEDLELLPEKIQSHFLSSAAA